MKINFSFLSVAFFILFSAEKLSAQNLVPNPSFEDTVACPWDLDLIDYCSGWSSFGNTPDYFNPCTISYNVNVPQNLVGFQFAASGNSYAGLATFDQSENYREILGRTLSSPLVIGTKYYVSMKVSFSNMSLFATNNIGISFSTVSYNWINNTAPINNQATVYSASINNDTANWVNVKGSFIADSLYQYIMIGSFFDDAHTDTLRVQGGTLSNHIYMSYYYIDDVCVSPDSLECDLNPEGIYNLPQQQIAIYPNPATEQLIIDNGQLIIKGIELFDLVGRKMMNDELLVKHSNHYSLNTKNFPRGYYFIRINTSEGMINRKIVLQ